MENKFVVSRVKKIRQQAACKVKILWQKSVDKLFLVSIMEFFPIKLFGLYKVGLHQVDYLNWDPFMQVIQIDFDSILWFLLTCLCFSVLSVLWGSLEIEVCLRVEYAVWLDLYKVKLQVNEMYFSNRTQTSVSA